MELPDLATLPPITKFIERCEVITIPAGAAPKDVTIQLPDADGAKVPARYTGSPPGLAVNDEVVVRATPQDTIKYVIDGTSGATLPKVGKRLAHVLFVSSTAPNADHTTIAAAITAASAGDIILLDAETWGLVIVTKAITLMGLDPVNTILQATADDSDTLRLTGANGIAIRNLTLDNTGAGTTCTCLDLTQGFDNHIIDNVIVTKTSGAPTNSYGIYNVNGTGILLNNVRVQITTGTNRYGYYSTLTTGSSAKIVGGSYEGSTDDIRLDDAQASLELSGPWLINDDLNIVAGSWTGNYHQSSDGLWIPQKFVGARVLNSANITLTTGVLKLLTFDSERYDNDTIHSTSTNTGRLTTQTEGYYTIVGNARWAANATGQRFLDIKLNGTTFIGIQSLDTTTGGFPAVTVTTTIYFLSVGDYVELHAFQNSGGNLDVVNFGNYSPEFMMHRMAQ